MSSFIIEGGHRLSGEITPQGAKNEALQILSATLLTAEPVTVNNVPDILDIRNLIALLQDMGVKVNRVGEGSYTFQADEVNTDYLNRPEFVICCE
ncbi:MAG: UDP-N-acetylglucosamine 1-carboxyvinyltransferase, partial [Muribaculaceae bacterium]|nr:UDP-N-acetylglucosamine 1-carboxyvinyltransferase [Muribaculaceae bacterium]